jgi:hypothetical protein
LLQRQCLCLRQCSGGVRDVALQGRNGDLGHAQG